MRDQEFADLAEYSYEKKLEAADIIGAGRVRMIDDAFGRPQDGLDLSGFDVPLYQGPTRGEVDETTIGIDPGGVKEMLETENPTPTDDGQ